MKGFDLRRRLLRQGESELLEQKHQIFLRLGVAGENNFPAVCGGQMNIEHLHGCEFFEDSAWSQPAGAGLELRPTLYEPAFFLYSSALSLYSGFHVH